MLLPQIVAAASTTLLLLAIAHKARTVKIGAEAHEPLLRRGERRRRHARLLIVVAGMAEAAILVALYVRPVFGFVGMATAALVYAVALRGLPADEPCACFGEFVAMSNRTALVRNLVLAVANVAACAAVLGGADPDLFSARTAEIGILWVASAAALGVVRHIRSGGAVINQGEGFHARE